MLPDPSALRPAPLLEGLGRALGDAVVVGAGAMGALSEPPLQWCGARVESGALAGLVLRGAKRPRIGVTQACRPASALFTVTRAQAETGSSSSTAGPPSTCTARPRASCSPRTCGARPRIC